MSNNYKVIDEKTWNRAMHCMVFRNSVEPAFCVTFEADITNFKSKVKGKGLSFTLAMVHAVCKCANEVEFDWGKYYEKDGRLFIPISIQAHHSFVDGIHIGQFVEKIQQYFEEI